MALFFPWPTGWVRIMRMPRRVLDNPLKLTPCLGWHKLVKLSLRLLVPKDGMTSHGVCKSHSARSEKRMVGGFE
jgi:hypothetical protein